MSISELSIRQPVAAGVLALLLITLGIGAIFQLPVREYPDVDPPVVSVATVYPGASAEVVERDVTQIIEDNLSGIEGVELITSRSREGFSQIDVEFLLGRDLYAAAADVRDKVSAVRNELPDDVEAPVISKASADADAMMWVTLTSERRDRRGLTDYAVRNLVDPLSVVPGVAQVIVGGARRYAMRIWLDANAMASRNITVQDVTRALRSENVELPAGRIETGPRELSVRTTTKLTEADEFRDLVLREGENFQITLGDVARVERGAESDRSAVYSSGEPGVGLGVVRQSGSNTLSVADSVKDELDRLRSILPGDINMKIVYNQAIFIEGSIEEVIKTLGITSALVVAVIFLFLGSVRSTIVPAATIPTSLIATFIVLLALGFSINTLTLLALVLAIGIVVDDSIVVLENVTRYREQGKPKLLAAVLGSREVVLAVVATTAVLAAVLLPIGAITGTIGRLFTEFAFALTAAVVFSSLLALTLGAMLSSKLAMGVDGSKRRGPLQWFSQSISFLERKYGGIAAVIVRSSWLAVLICVGVAVGAYFIATSLPGKLAPTEDRGVFIVPITAPEGASLSETTKAVREIEAILEPRTGDGGPIEDIISIVGVGRQGPPQVTSGLMIVKLRPWDERQISQQALVNEVQPAILSVPGAEAIPINPPSLVPTGFGKPIQFVISGPDYQSAYQWAQQVRAKAREMGTMRSIELGYNEKSPQLQVEINRRLAADLGLSVADIGETLRVFLGGTDVTEYYRAGETYEVVVRGQAVDRDRVEDVNSLYVRAQGGELVSLGSVVNLTESGTAAEYRRVARQPSVVLSAVPAPGEDIGSILASLEQFVERELPDAARVNYLGFSKEFQQSSAGILVVFALALLVVYFVLSALFESFVYPIVIMVAVPLAITGGLAALWAFGFSLNTFSQIALLLLVGLLAKNAILLVDFSNQRRREGIEIEEAILQAARTRFRPVLMTSIATTFGALPLALATGPGAESREVMGIVILFGTIVATAVTLFIVPGLYRLLARFAGIPGSVSRRLEEQRDEEEGEGGKTKQAYSS